MKVSGLSAEDERRWNALDEEIRKKLEIAVNSGINAESEEAKTIAQLHKEWLCVPLPKYTPEIHRGIAAMYVCDERFTKYYDRNVEGCAQLLCDAVKKWI